MFLPAKISLIIVSALLITIDLAAQVPVEGVFCHPPTGDCIKVQPAEGGILVKRSVQKSWRLFSRADKNIYFDRKADRIEVLSPVELVFVKNNSVKGLHYVFQELVENNNPQQNWIYQPGNYPNLQRMEGLWFSDQYQEYLIVVETREGIKVRLKDTRLWYNYNSAGNNDHFVDGYNNKYIFRGEELIYFHHDGLHSIVFRKISDDFDGY